MSAMRFLETLLKDFHGLHELQRNRGYLVYLDTSEAIQGFKALGRFIIFLSCLWLSSDTIQFHAVTESLKIMTPLCAVQV